MAADLLHHHRHSSIHSAIRPLSSVPFAPDPTRSFVVSYLRVIGHGLSLAALSRSDDEFIGGSRAEWPCIWSTEWSACFVRKANAENEVFIGACHDARAREHEPSPLVNVSAPIVTSSSSNRLSVSLRQTLEVRERYIYYAGRTASKLLEVPSFRPRDEVVVLAT